MDEAKRTAFVQHARARGGATRAVAVPLDLFFDGNDGEDDYGSIAANTDFDHADIRRALERLRAHPSVAEVFVELDLLQSDESFATDPEDDWPYANGVGVFTTLSPTDVDSILADVTTDPSSGPESVRRHPLVDEPALPAGKQYVQVWWD